MMTCVCPFPSGAQRSRSVSVGRRAVGVQGRTSRPGDRVVTRSGYGLDVDVAGIERRAVVVLGHVDSQGGSRGNLRAAVDQRADRFFLQNIPPRPPLRQAGRLSGPIGGASGCTCMCVARTETTALGGSGHSKTTPRQRVRLQLCDSPVCKQLAVDTDCRSISDKQAYKTSSASYLVLIHDHVWGYDDNCRVH
jgi:hypothetical protein